jgi:hypothetical protein
MTTVKFYGGPLDGKVQEDFEILGYRISQMEVAERHPHWMHDNEGHRTRICDSPDCMFIGHRLWSHEYQFHDLVDGVVSYTYVGRFPSDPFADLPLASD